MLDNMELLSIIIVGFFYSVGLFIVVVQLTSNGSVLGMFIHCKIVKFRHVKYDAIVLFLHVDHDLPG